MYTREPKHQHKNNVLLQREREAESIYRKADGADEHREQLRSDRERIDGCTQEMRDCDRRIDQHRADVPIQQELVRSRRGVAVTQETGS